MNEVGAHLPSFAGKGLTVQPASAFDRVDTSSVFAALDLVTIQVVASAYAHRY